MGHADQVDDQTLAAELAARMDRDQQARTREPPDWDEVAAVDAQNTAWLAGVLDQRGVAAAKPSRPAGRVRGVATRPACRH